MSKSKPAPAPSRYPKPLHVDRHLTFEHGDYADEGHHCESASDFILQAVLGFCGCGQPAAALRHLQSVLRHIHNLQHRVWTKLQTYEQWEEDGAKLFVSEGAACLFYYVLDEKGLLEHGGSVPGWLSDAGVRMLEDLDVCLDFDEAAEVS